MALLNWKRAAKISLVLFALSLPMWALHDKDDWHHHHCEGRDCGGGGGQNVPDGGSLLAYTGFSGAVIAGGMALARKSRAL